MQQEYLAIDTTQVPWKERPNPHVPGIILRKELFIDPDTGMQVRLVRYPAGVINPRAYAPVRPRHVRAGRYARDAPGSFGPGASSGFPRARRWTTAPAPPAT